MRKKFKKIINLSFLIVFLLGYIGTIVPGSVIASLLDIKVYAEGEEGEIPEIQYTVLNSIELNNEAIKTSINSNEKITADWTDSTLFDVSDQYEVLGITWENENGEYIDENSSLENSHVLTGTIEVWAMDDGVLGFEFDSSMTVDNVSFNGSSVYEVSVSDADGIGHNTYLYVKITCDVISSTEAINISTVKVGSAKLGYLANESPEYTARSLEEDYYTVGEEIFTDISTGTVLSGSDRFEAGKTYSYSLKINSVNESVATIQNVTSLEINGTNYELVFEGENKNATLTSDGLLFTGVPNIEIEGNVSSDLQISLKNYTSYNNGDFIYDNGIVNILIDGIKYTDALNQDGTISISAGSANIEVNAIPNDGYTANVSINGTNATSATIDSLTNINVEFNKIVYRLDFETNGGNKINPLTNQSEGTEIDLSKYVPTRTDYKFEGWYQDQDLTQKVSTITITDNVTVYANWVSVKGEVTLTTNNPEGLDTVSVNNNTVVDNKVNAYIDGDYTNTLQFTPVNLGGYKIVSIKITDALGNVTNAGPGNKNEAVNVEVAGSSSYNIEITLEKDKTNTEYNLTLELNGLLSSNTNTVVTNNEIYMTTLSVNPDNEMIDGITGYSLPNSVTVMIGNVELSEVNYNSKTGELIIPSELITDDITINANVITKVLKPSIQDAEFVYDGNDKTIKVNNYFENLMTLNGELTRLNAGTYTLSFSLNNNNYVWEDNTRDDVELTWAIDKADLNLSVSLEDWLVDGEANEAVISGNLGNGVETIEYKVKDAADNTYTVVKPTEVGSYTVRYSVSETDNYKSSSVTDDFNISEGIITVKKPHADVITYDYTGNEVSLEIIDYNSELVNKTGDDTASKIGSYTVTYSLMNSNYIWEDGTTEDIIIKWNIRFGKPNVSNDYTYNTVKLTWDEVAGSNGYQVYKCNSKGASCKKLATVTTPTYTHKKLSYYTNYYYKVRAYTKIDNKTVYSDFTDLIKVTTKLNTPEVKATKDRYQEVRLSWNKISGATNYYVYRCNETGGSCKKIANVKTNSYVDKKGSEGVTYIYKVRAYKSKKYSSYSNLVEGFRLNDNLSVTVKNTGYLTNTITISTKEGATKYQIYRSTNNKKYTLIKEFESTNEDIVYVDSKLAFNKKYYYRVRAYNGVNYTAYNSKYATTSYIDSPVVVASKDRYQEVKLTWDKVPGATKYYIYKCNESGGSCKTLGSTSSLSYTDKKATEGKNTYYKVKAYKSKKYSKYSNLAEGFRLNDNLSVTVKNTDYLANTITIANKEGVTKYQIYRSTDNKKYTLIHEVESTNEDVVYLDEGLLYNKKYYYRVRAYNGVNYTAYSSKYVTTTKLAKPEVNNTVNGNVVVLEINKVPQATGYEIYYSNDSTTWKKVKTTTSLKYTGKLNSGTNYYRVRAYKKVSKKTYYSDFYYVEPIDFE